MILDNLTRAIKTQNWLAAGVEFVIVIAGVVLGFQINAWNEGRQEAELRAATIERLHADFEEIVEYSDRSLASIERSLVALRLIRASLLEGALPEASREQFENGLYRGYTHREPAPRSSTFAEIESSGRMALLKNEALLRALFRYDQQVEASGDTFLHARLIKTEYMQAFTRQFSTPPGGEREPGARYDFDAMAADLEFADAVEQLTAMQDVYQTWHASQRERAQAVLDELEAELGD